MYIHIKITNNWIIAVYWCDDCCEQVCMEPELGEMYMNDREKFEEVARAWTWRYAMHDVVTPL